MGFRFRKSYNLGGGFRVNFSKSGVGWSWGTKGYRVTKTAKGTTRTTYSIPGTGISYVNETSKRKRGYDAIPNNYSPGRSSPYYSEQANRIRTGMNRQYGAKGGYYGGSYVAPQGGQYYSVDPAWPLKSRGVAALLAIFLGTFGAHKFYLGRGGMGLLYLVFCWTGIPTIAGIIEGLGYLISNDIDFELKHRVRLS